MSDMIVTCAGCGKRYRGAPGKKFKCSGCANHFSVPPEPREAREGTIFCSQCWTELDMPAELSACPVCAQKVAPKFGGKAAAANATSSGLSNGVETDERDKHILELKAQVAELQRNLETSKAEVERESTQRITAQAQLNEFRDVAVSALEPLGIEYTRRMRELMNE